MWEAVSDRRPIPLDCKRRPAEPASYVQFPASGERAAHDPLDHDQR